MVNPERGDVAIVIDGVERPMRLTLGALAALEARLETGSLVAMVEAFERGNVRTSQLVALLWAGLNGAGWDVSYDQVAASRVDGGPMEAVRAAGRLLRVTFADQGA